MTKQHAKARTPSHEPGRVDLAVTAGDSAVFSSLIEPYRRELHVHCYRLLGSLQDAEDLVQETLLRAWQHFEDFKGYASLRTWLYTIATNACLDTLKRRRPRTLPAAASPPMNPLTPLRKLLLSLSGLSPSLTSGWLRRQTIRKPATADVKAFRSPSSPSFSYSRPVNGPSCSSRMYWTGTRAKLRICSRPQSQP